MWSDGNARLDPVDVVTADAPVRGLTRVGAGWWLNPKSARPLLDPILARAASVNSVIALYPSDGDRGPHRGVGVHVGRVGGSAVGFSSIVSDPWTGWAGMEDAEHGFVHEWLHQVEAVYRALGLSEDDLPSLHDVADRRTTRSDAPDRDETYVEHERPDPVVAAVVPRLHDRDGRSENGRTTGRTPRWSGQANNLEVTLSGRGEDR